MNLTLKRSSAIFLFGLLLVLGLGHPNRVLSLSKSSITPLLAQLEQYDFKNEARYQQAIADL